MASAVLDTELRPMCCARVMTRCECTGLHFDEVARRVHEQGHSLDAVQSETGCGRLCTACIPDLHDHLASRRS